MPDSRRRPAQPEHTRRLSTAEHRTNVSDARPPESTGLRNREIRYLVTMAFRVACFVAMIWTPGWGRLVLLLGAAVLPYIAVLAANQTDRRTKAYRIEAVGDPLRPQLTDRAVPAGETAAVVVSPDREPRP